MFWNKQVGDRAMPCAQQDSCQDKSRNAGSENDRGLSGGWPQIISPPSHYLRSVPVSQKTGQHPNGEDQPRKKESSLELPDIPGDKSAERERFDKVQESQRLHAMFSILDALRPGC
jgi:hypothetical protein